MLKMKKGGIMNPQKKINLLTALVAMTVAPFLSHAKVQPIDDVTVQQEKEGVLLEANVLLSSPCYDLRKGTAVVNTNEDKITLRQTAEKTGEQYCPQVIDNRQVVYDLGEVPDGEYKVVDRYDKEVIEKVKVSKKSNLTIEPAE
jgi:hypothetical protein